MKIDKFFFKPIINGVILGLIWIFFLKLFNESLTIFYLDDSLNTKEFIFYSSAILSLICLVFISLFFEIKKIIFIIFFVISFLLNFIIFHYFPDFILLERHDIFNPDFVNDIIIIFITTIIITIILFFFNKLLKMIYSLVKKS